jgi:hypothetical protein
MMEDIDNFEKDEIDRQNLKYDEDRIHEELEVLKHIEKED